MKKAVSTLTVLFLFAIATPALAQKFYKGKLIFADGKIMEGFVEPPAKYNTGKINFKKSLEGEKETYESNALKSVVIKGPSEDYQFDWGTYMELLSFGRTKESKPHWLFVLIKGPVTLYTMGQRIKFKDDELLMKNDGVINYYAKRESEKTATDIGFYMPNTAGLDADFRSKTSKYFADYPALAKKIEDQKMKLTDVLTIVKEYNSWASARKKK
ncbi:MAG TPA: hypothetical protein VEB86_07895 [Chryseosolibacter sp.]|nr:hypothetical protein [Chryseosolibacter sp.]